MTPSFLLNWLILALSLFNVSLMLWLALTVWLNAARRTLGVWVTSVSLLVGGAFFVSHTLIVGEPLSVRPGIDVWWQAGLLAVLGLPFAWYGITLWHTGFWNSEPSDLRTRHFPWLVLALILLALLSVLLATANPLPSFTRVLLLDLAPTPTVGDWPVLVVAFPVYSLLCVMLALDALLRPGAATRLGGEAARHRARPWLLAATVLLLAVSLLVAGVMAWLVQSLANARTTLLGSEFLIGIGVMDVLISGLLAGVLVLVGQAIVSYEVFTGQTLPRQGLQRYWRRAIILAAGFGVVVGGALAEQWPATFIIILTVLVTTVFYALLSWRAYAERERALRQLRPFVSSERRYETALAPEEFAPSASALFATLCREVLGARRACLVPLGALAPLAGPPLMFPNGEVSAFNFTELTAHFTSPQTASLPLDPHKFAGLHWAVPLWSERGLIGLLLLDEKTDGGLYAQEDVEMARAAGERLLDTQASAELTRRLVALQRQRLAEAHVLDQRVRRELHDEILPRLHAALLEISAEAPASVGLTTLTQVHHQISDLLRSMPSAAAPLLERAGLFGALKQVVEGELKGAFERVQWDAPDEIETETRRLPAFVQETAFYAGREALRNAARYGRGGSTARPLTLRVRASAQPHLVIVIEDDGVGLGLNEQPRGTGQGLALHSTLMAVLGGSLAVETQPGQFTRLTLTLPNVFQT